MLLHTYTGMPQDQVKAVMPLNLLTHHNMVNQSLLVSASLNTKHPTGMHSTWFHLELGGRAKGKVLEMGRSLFAFSPCL